MLRSLRGRLVLSHILPLLVIIPLIGAALTSILESRFLLPQLATNLLGDARLLAEISRSEYELWGDPVLFEIMLSRVQLDPAVQVMFLTQGGQLLFSNDPGDDTLLGSQLRLPGLERAQSGREAVLTNYTGQGVSKPLIDVLVPVEGLGGQVSGIVRMTYRLDWLNDLIRQFRVVVAGVLLGALAAGALLGLALAVNIGRPVQQVTQAINDLARGSRREILAETGPQEVRELIRAVNFLVTRLQGLEQARRQLLANLVHELGRPLGALRSAVQALGRGASQDPALLAELAVGMDDEAARMQYVLEELAHLHDQVLGTLELNRQPLVLGDWLRGVLRPWQAAAQEKRLAWQEEIPATLPVIQVDGMRLAQVIGNLLSNAVKYTPPGGWVRFSVGVEAGLVWLRVEDNGPGIPEAEQQKIFEPFYRGDQGWRIKQGMGLGLSIARDLVNAHGGRLVVASTPGQGSQFTVYLPDSLD